MPWDFSVSLLSFLPSELQYLPYRLRSAAAFCPCHPVPCAIEPAFYGNFVPQVVKTCVVLKMPSTTQVLWMGMYCFVTTLIISCATMPPVSAEMLCISLPFARTTSWAAWMIRSSSFASATIFDISDRIAFSDRAPTRSLAFSARYMGMSEGVRANSALSSAPREPVRRSSPLRPGRVTYLPKL